MTGYQQENFKDTLRRTVTKRENNHIYSNHHKNYVGKEEDYYE